jgi:two-component system capsular synthesis sensor histidine kinase RcsC
LRALRLVTVVWITRTGPHRPAARGDGVLEVSEFSHAALAAGIELAVSGDAPEVEAPLDEAAEAAAHASAPAFDPALRGLRVLVAEDNPLNQTLITEQLTTLGCMPVIVGDGRQALAVLSQTDVDLVLTDIHMPVMDGYALIAALRETHPALPVLAFSAVTGVEQAEEWRRRGFANYILKPASLRQLETGLMALGLRGPAPEEAATGPAPAASLPGGTLDSADKARYMAMLKDHLSTDLPKLAGIVETRDWSALRDWAHSAAGAFLIVHEPEFAAQCRVLQRMCDVAGGWTPDIAAHALALHDGLRSRFGLDEPFLH